MSLLSIGVVRSEPVEKCYTYTRTTTSIESDYYKVLYQCPKTLPNTSKTLPGGTNAIPSRTIASQSTCFGYADKVLPKTYYEVECYNVRTYYCYNTKCCSDTVHHSYRDTVVPCKPMQIMERRNDSATKISTTKISATKTTATRPLKSLSNDNDSSFNEEISNPNFIMRVGLNNQLTCYTRNSYVYTGSNEGKHCISTSFDYSVLSTTFTTPPPGGFTIHGIRSKVLPPTQVPECPTEIKVTIPLNTSVMGYATIKQIEATTSTYKTKTLPITKSITSSTSTTLSTSTSSTSSKTLSNSSVNKENLNFQTVTYAISEYTSSNQRNEKCIGCTYTNNKLTIVLQHRRVRCPVMSFEGREDIVNPYYIGGPDLAHEDNNQFSSIFTDKTEVPSNTTIYAGEKIFTENVIVDHTLYCVEKQYQKTYAYLSIYCSSKELPKEITTDASLTTTENLLPTFTSITETETPTEIEADTVTEMEETSLPTEFIIETETESAEIETESKSTAEIETETESSAEIETETESSAKIETETESSAKIETETESSAEIETETESSAEIETEDGTTTITTEPTSTQESCSPVVVTITEKKKITITEKETVTVTVNKEDDEKEQCAPKWGQCGGINYHGPTCCSSGSRCVQYDSYYSQCV